MLVDKILDRKPGILLYGLTPPKKDHCHEKMLEISQKQCARINSMDIDGLILYDIQDESERTSEERSFPFIETIDPSVYGRDYLSDVKVPKIIYRYVGKYTETELEQWLVSDYMSDGLCVFVGVAADNQKVRMSLPDAYALAKRQQNVLVGGILISERHTQFNNEHLRVANKVKSGSRYFISQMTYNAEAAKNFLSDYYYHCRENGTEAVPIIINLTPCGSLKTLEFMKWLGLSFPKWLENDLANSVDILDKSLKISRDIFEELLDFGMEKGIPIGCSVESISTRKVEIDASVQLVNDIKDIYTKRRIGI